MRYWDTSALVKLFVWEPDSPRFRELAARHPVLVTSDFARREILLTLCRKEAGGDLKSGMTELVFQRIQQQAERGRIRFVPLDGTVDSVLVKLSLQLYRSSPPQLIRTLDAIHLAAAKSLAADELVTLDGRMATAARQLGFTVIS